MMFMVRKGLVLGGLLFSVALNAQYAGQIDFNYADNGELILSYGNATEIMSAVKLTDGRLAVFHKPGNGSNYYGGISIFDDNGDIDSSFAVNGTYNFSPIMGSTILGDMGVFEDGRILYGYRGLTCLKSNGIRDSTFGLYGNTFPNLVPVEFNFVEGNKLMFFSEVSGGSKGQISQINSDGSLDNDFGNNGIIDLQANIYPEIKSVRKVVRMNDGKILIGFTDNGDSQSSGYKFRLLKLDQSGNADKSFGDNGQIILEAYSGYTPSDVIIDDNNKILVTGALINVTKYTEMVVYRINSDGTFDTSFGNDGIRFIDISQQNDGANSATIQVDGKILIIGYSTGRQITSSDFAVARLNVDGSNDLFFGSNGRITYNFPFMKASFAQVGIIQNQNKIIVVGRLLNASGGLDIGIIKVLSGLPTPVGKIDRSSRFEVFPNPCQGKVTIRSNDHTMRSISVINSTGQLVYKAEMNEKECTIDLPESLNNGVYLLLIENKMNQTSMKKLVLNR